MEFGNLYTLITLALSLGIVHALDADHIMAVSALSTSNINSRSSVKFCLRWALGHGVTLITIGACVFLFGMAIPDQLSVYAEHIVGLVLIFLGILIFIKLRQKNIHLHYHQHDGLPEHAHWHAHNDSHQNSLKKNHTNTTSHRDQPHRHHHSAVMVGVLHGAAGSAPLLVLIPIAKLATPVYGIIYLLVFSIAVIIAMIVFGGLLGKLYQWLSNYGAQTIKYLRISIASGAIVVGGLLLAGV